MINISWKKIQLVIFDVDGTLYEQSKLRKRMLYKLLSYYAFRPWRFDELLILYHFRKEREKRAGLKEDNLQDKQYEWCAEKAQETTEKVRHVVDKWIFEMPNSYLKQYRYPGVSEFFELLKDNGIKTAIYSDYNSKNKLIQMQLQVDMEVSSTDKLVNSFKPLPDGLNLILSTLNILDKDTCLFIGDRFELDGLCAENAGIPFLLATKKQTASGLYNNLVKQIENQLISAQ